MRKSLVFLTLGAILLSPLSAFAEYSASSAQNYLLAHADNPWSTMALSALGAGNIPADYLKSVSGSTAIEYAAPILAISAIGQDPRTFGGQDYIAQLKAYYSGGQIGDPNIINDDIFGLLALISTGESLNAPEVSGTKNFILSHQQTNGGWGFAASGPADSNMTAAAIVAAIASGVSSSDGKIQNGLNYLKTAQNDDGGFTYDPQSQYGTDSDSSSTAWVLWALAAAGISPADWSKSGNSPVKYLESNQAPGGYFKYQSNSSEDAFSAVTTAYAAIALAGKTLPLNAVSSTSKFRFRIEGSSSVVCSGETQGPTALDIIKNSSSQCGFTYHIQSTSFGLYLDQIGGDKAEGMTGWLYFVNYFSPSVGAADYVLKSGDSVIWHFGNFDWQPEAPSKSDVSLKVNIEKGEVQGAVVSFTIDPGSIDFGTLKPGQSNSQNLAIKNTGNTNISVRGTVSGDGVFADNLSLDSISWREFQKQVIANQTQTISASLAVPSNYSGSVGIKTGTITLWAAAQ